MSRKSARETAMKLVYQMDLNETGAEETLKNFYDHGGEDLWDDEREYIENCVKGVYENLNKIDNYIEKYSKNWKINRIAKVDLAIMRLAIYEMLYRDDVPDVVAVDEAVELSKEYGGENSYSFINGVLGNVIKEINPDAQDTWN
ncbi:transcription antitermination factor NusB [Fonticella tunisiensis]|uniref:Transcription antitermination protein NusB n=1 Tax=Fonticella tunisiensis TaxID=1096341 RepID=A0A4R7KRG7_9CLOT|nr:transcription antitermination factor NusB [Fonticella tunisiensis]TDT61943.1 NusB antitermination factor [Fonticella tunisiensis]